MPARTLRRATCPASSPCRGSVAKIRRKGTTPSSKLLSWISRRYYLIQAGDFYGGNLIHKLVESNMAMLRLSGPINTPSRSSSAGAAIVIRRCSAVLGDGPADAAVNGARRAGGLLPLASSARPSTRSILLFLLVWVHWSASFHFFSFGLSYPAPLAVYGGGCAQPPSAFRWLVTYRTSVATCAC